ncbi:hypothetical protein Pcinc_036432 [Petrolisthes cinctipes]|uniref:Uncharacterized protein n=1 Tax=Petrolisthes cinctipes TaxID=88211 RepID=A0AAE1BXS3_PETCI|nr:hypothetical protein Pcinc_036432 [Petrolisthes cinctipes]
MDVLQVTGNVLTKKEEVWQVRSGIHSPVLDKDKTGGGVNVEADPASPEVVLHRVSRDANNNNNNNNKIDKRTSQNLKDDGDEKRKNRGGIKRQDFSSKGKDDRRGNRGKENKKDTVKEPYGVEEGNNNDKNKDMKRPRPLKGSLKKKKKKMMNTNSGESGKGKSVEEGRKVRERSKKRPNKEKKNMIKGGEGGGGDDDDKRIKKKKATKDRLKNREEMSGEGKKDRKIGKKNGKETVVLKEKLKNSKTRDKIRKEERRKTTTKDGGKEKKELVENTIITKDRKRKEGNKGRKKMINDDKTINKREKKKNNVIKMKENKEGKNRNELEKKGRKSKKGKKEEEAKELMKKMKKKNRKHKARGLNKRKDRKKTKGLKKKNKDKKKDRKKTKGLKKKSKDKKKDRKKTKGLKKKNKDKRKDRKKTKGLKSKQNKDKRKKKKKTKGLKSKQNKEERKSKKDKDKKDKSNRDKKDKKRKNRDKKDKKRKRGDKKNKDKTAGGKMSKEDENETRGKPKAKKDDCKTKGKCKKMKGKCKTNDWVSENKKKCKNQITKKSGCPDDCTCCLKKKCTANYAKKKCTKEKGTVTKKNACKDTDKKNKYVYASKCTCCLPCKTEPSCKALKGKCKLECSDGEFEEGACGGDSDCKCCRGKGDTPPTSPPGPTSNIPSIVTSGGTTPTSGKPITVQPTPAPSVGPTVQPTPGPSGGSTNQPGPSVGPTVQPTPGPSVGPTNQPGPSVGPTVQPTPGPSVGPTVQPTPAPSVGPTNQPGPSVGPTNQPGPSVGPTVQPTPGPSVGPTVQPTPGPSGGSTNQPGPSVGPTVQPTPGPSVGPTVQPTPGPSVGPTNQPAPSVGPTDQPTPAPSVGPTDQPPSGVATSAPSSTSRKSVFERAADAMSAVAAEAAGALTDNDKLQKNVNSRMTLKNTDSYLAAFEAFEVLLENWRVNIDRLQESDIEVILNFAREIIILREEIDSASSIIDQILQSKLTTAGKACSFVVGQLQKTISLLDRDEKLTQDKEFATIVDENINTLLSLMEEVSASLTTTTETLNIESSSAYLTIVRLKKVMQSVTTATRGALTKNLIDTLEHLEGELRMIVTHVQDGTVQFTADQASEVAITITAISSAEAAIELLQTEVLQKASSHQKALRLENLARAVAVVRDYINKLKNKIKEQSTSVQTFEYTVDNSLISLLTSLRESPDIVTDADIDKIYDFEVDATSLLEKDSIQVNDLNTLEEKSKRLERSVISKKEAASSRTSLVEKAELIYNALYYVESINIIVDDIIYITEDATTSNKVDIIANVTDFLKSPALKKYNEALVMKLEEYSFSLSELEDSATGDVKYEGIDDLFDLSYQLSITLYNKATDLESQAEKAALFEEAETVTRLTLTVQKTAGELAQKVSTNTTNTRSSSSRSNNKLLVGLVRNLTLYMTKFSSSEFTSDEITEADELVAQFVFLVNSTTTIKGIKGLDDLTRLAKSASDAAKIREKNLKISLSNKETIEILETALYLLDEIYFFAYYKNLSEASSQPVNIIVEEVISELEYWQKRGLTNIKLNDVFTLEGLYLVLEERDLESDETLGGILELFNLTNSVYDSIINSLSIIEESDSEVDAEFIAYDLFNLISEIEDELKYLLVVTESSTSTSVDGSVVEETVQLLEEISQKPAEERNYTDVDNVEMALFSLYNLTEYINGETIENLDDYIEEVMMIKKIFERDAFYFEEYEEYNVLEEIEFILFAILDILSEFNIESDGTEIYEDEFFDDVYEFMFDLYQRPSSANEFTLEELLDIEEYIYEYLYFVDYRMTYRGFNYQIQDIISVTNMTLSLVIEAAEQQDTMDEFSDQIFLYQDVVFYLEESLYLLESIFLFTATDATYNEEVSIITSELQALSPDVTNITSDELFYDMFLTLLNIEETLSKPDGIEELLLVTENLLELLEVYLEENEFEFTIDSTIDRLALLEDTLYFIIDGLNEYIDILSPEQLIGEEDYIFDYLLYDLRHISSNVYQTTEFMISDVSYLYSEAESILEDLDSSEGIGNLYITLIAANDALDKVSNILLELFEYYILNQEEMRMKSFLFVLESILSEANDKLSAIGSITNTGPEVSSLEEVIDLLDKISSSSFSDVTQDILNSTLAILEGLTVNAGESIPGLLQILFLAEDAIESVETELDFIDISKTAIIQILTLSEAVDVMEVIDEELESLYLYFRDTEVITNETRPLYVIEDLLYLVDTLTVHDITLETIDDFRSLLEDMYEVYIEFTPDLSGLFKAKEGILHLKYNTERKIQEEMRMAEENKKITLLGNTIDVIFDIVTKLEPSFSETIRSAQDIESNMTELLHIFTELYETQDVTQEQLYHLYELNINLDNLDTQQLSFEDLDQLLHLAFKCQELFLEDEDDIYISIRQSNRQNSLQSVLYVLAEMQHHLEYLITGTGLPTREISDATLVELKDMLYTITVHNADEVVYELETYLDYLMSLELEFGTTVAEFKDLVLVVPEKMGEFEDVIGVYKRIHDISMSLDFTERQIVVLETLHQLAMNDASSNDNEFMNQYRLQNALIDVVYEASEENLDLLRQEVENLAYIGADMLDSYTADYILELTEMALNTLMDDERKLFPARNQLEYIEPLLEAQDLLVYVQSMAKPLQELGESENRTSEGSLIVFEYIDYLSRYDENIMIISEESLEFFIDSEYKLELLVLNGESVVGAQALKSLTEYVLASISREVGVMVRNTYMQHNHVIMKETQNVIYDAVDVMLSFPEGDDAIVTLAEMDRVLKLLHKIKQGDYDMADLTILSSYLELLDYSWELFYPGARAPQFNEALDLGSSVEKDLSHQITESLIEQDIMQTINEGKMLKMYVGEAVNILKGLDVVLDVEESNSFSHPVLTHLRWTMESINKEPHYELMHILDHQLHELTEVTANLTAGTAVEGLLYALLSARSAEARLSITHSRAYQIDSLHEDEIMLQDALEELYHLEELLKYVEMLGNNTTGVETSMVVFDDLATLLENITYYTEADVLTLRYTVFFIDAVIVPFAVENVISNVDGITMLVHKHILMTRKYLYETQYKLRQSKQSLYSMEAVTLLENVYQSIMAHNANHTDIGDAIPVDYITQFMYALKNLDIFSISAMDLSDLSFLTSAIIDTIGYSEQTITFLDKLRQELAHTIHESRQGLSLIFDTDRTIRSYMYFGKNQESLDRIHTDVLNILDETESAASVYEEVPIIRDLYQYLITYGHDMNTVPYHFGDILDTFHLSSVSVSSGHGIQYLRESLVLLDHYLAVMESSMKHIEETDKIIHALDMQRILEHFAFLLDYFLYSGPVEGGHEGYYNESHMFPHEGHHNESHDIPHGFNSSSNMHDSDSKLPFNSQYIFVHFPSSGLSHNKLPDNFFSGGSLLQSYSFTLLGPDGDPSPYNTHHMPQHSQQDVSLCSMDGHINPFNESDHIYGTIWDEDEYMDPIENFMELVYTLEHWLHMYPDIDLMEATEIMRKVNYFFSMCPLVTMRNVEGHHLEKVTDILYKVIDYMHEITDDMMKYNELSSELYRSKASKDILYALEETLSPLVMSGQGSLETAGLVATLTEHLLEIVDYSTTPYHQINHLHILCLELSASVTTPPSDTDVAIDLTELITEIHRVCDIMLHTEATLSSILDAAKAIQESEMYLSKDLKHIHDLTSFYYQSYLANEVHELLTSVYAELDTALNEGLQSRSDPEAEDEYTDELDTTDLSIILTLVESHPLHLKYNLLSSLGEIVYHLRKHHHNYHHHIIHYYILDEIHHMLDKHNYTWESTYQLHESTEHLTTLLAATTILHHITPHVMDIMNITGINDTHMDRADNASDHEAVHFVTDFLIQLSLTSFSIDQMSLLHFKYDWHNVEYNMDPTVNPYFDIWSHFLIYSEVTTLELLFKSVIPGVTARAVTQRMLYVGQQALHVVEDITEALEYLSESPISKHSVKQSTNYDYDYDYDYDYEEYIMEITEQLDFVLYETSEILKEFASGYINERMLQDALHFAMEIMDLAMTLDGSGNITFHMDFALEEVIAGIEMALDRAHVEEMEDKLDMNIDALYNFFSQLYVYFETEMMTEMYLHHSNNESITDDHTTDLPELDVVVEMLSELPQVDPHHVQHYLDFLSDNVTSLIVVLVDVNNTVSNYDVLFMAIKDIVAELELRDHVIAYNRVRETVTHALKHIMLSPQPGNHSTSLVFTEEMVHIHNSVVSLKHRLYEVCKFEVRHFSREINGLMQIMNIFGRDIIYIDLIEANLAYIYYTAHKYQQFAEVRYMFNHVYAHNNEMTNTTTPHLPSIEGEHYEECQLNHPVHNDTFDFIVLIMGYENDDNMNCNGSIFCNHLNHSMMPVHSMESAERLVNLYELTHKTLKTRVSVATVVLLLRRFLETNEYHLSIHENETSIETVDEIIYIVHELGTDYTFDKEMLNDLDELSMKLQYLVDFEKSHVVLGTEDMNHLSEILHNLDVSVEGLESALSYTVAFENLNILLHTSLFLQSSLMNLTGQQGSEQLANILLDLEQWYDNFQGNFVIYQVWEIEQLQFWAEEVESLAGEEGTTQLSNIDDLIHKLHITVDHINIMRSSLFIHVDKYQRVLDLSEEGCSNSPVTNIFLLGIASNSYQLCPGLDTVLAQLSDGLAQLQVTEDPEIGRDSMPLLLDIYSHITAFHPHYSTLEKLSECLLRVENTDSLLVMRETVELVLEEIFIIRNLLAEFCDDHHRIGESATKTLVMQCAVNLVTDLLVHVETHMNTTDMNNTDLSMTGALMKGRGIVLQWCLDPEAVNSVTVMALSDLLHDEGVEEFLHDEWFLWLLHLSRTPLLVQENLWRSFVNVDEALMRYNEASYILEYLADTVEQYSHMDNSTGNDIFTGEDKPPPNNKNNNNYTWSHWDDGEKEEGEHRIELQHNMIGGIVNVLLEYNSHWSKGEVITYSDLHGVVTQTSELMQLLEASHGSALHGMKVDHLWDLVMNNLNITDDIHHDLTSAEMFLMNFSDLVLSISFLETFDELLQQEILTLNYTLQAANLTDHDHNTTHDNMNATYICESEDLYQIASFLLDSVKMMANESGHTLFTLMQSHHYHDNNTNNNDTHFDETVLEDVLVSAYSLTRAIIRQTEFGEETHFQPVIDILGEVKDIVYDLMDDFRSKLINDADVLMDGDDLLCSQSLSPLLLWCWNSTQSEPCH